VASSPSDRPCPVSPAWPAPAQRAVAPKRGEAVKRAAFEAATGFEWIDGKARPVAAGGARLSFLGFGLLDYRKGAGVAEGLVRLSGAPGARFRLKIDGLGKETLQGSEGPGKGTILRLLWSGPLAPFKNGRLLARVRERCSLSPVPLLINGRDMPRDRSGSGQAGLYFEEGPVHGHISVPKWPSPSSTLTPAVASVTLDNALVVKLNYLQVTGYLNSDDFTMNISQTGVVNNTRCSRALAAVARQVPLLLEYVLRMHGAALPAAGKVMAYGGMQDCWKKCVEKGKPLEPGLLGGLLKRACGLILASGGAAAASATSSRSSATSKKTS